MSPARLKLPDIVESTAEFEKWAARHVNLIRSDVKLKHRNMAEAPFPFFRATFYRWAQWWPIVCQELARAPGHGRGLNYFEGATVAEHTAGAGREMSGRRRREPQLAIPERNKARRSVGGSAGSSFKPSYSEG